MTWVILIQSVSKNEKKKCTIVVLKYEGLDLVENHCPFCHVQKKHTQTLHAKKN
jgi:heterodisulfide reductase subunit B